MSFLELENVGKTYKTGSVEVEALKGVTFGLEDYAFKPFGRYGRRDVRQNSSRREGYNFFE